jgi:hypothetical protein
MRCLRPSIMFSLGLVGCTADAPPQSQPTAIRCSTPQITGRLAAELSEASGLAASLRTPGLWWTLNDDGPPQLFGIDSTGLIRTRVRIGNAAAGDWESLASSPCAQGSCLYIGDVGDNLRSRGTVGVYRLPEPVLGQLEVAAEAFAFRYPDGPHDAEAIFVLPGEQLYVLTKGRSEPLTLYRYPGALRAGTVPTLEVVLYLSRSFVQLPAMITGAGATADGQWMVVRTYSRLQLYRFDREALVPQLADGGLDLTPLREFQGEGVDVRADGTVVLVSEKGLDQGSAPVSLVRCALSS